MWRRERDSNPRGGYYTPYSLSRGAPSTTQPPLLGVPYLDNSIFVMFFVLFLVMSLLWRVELFLLPVVFSCSVGFCY